VIIEITCTKKRSAFFSASILVSKKRFNMELIKIYKGSLVDARELHQFLESKRRFANWIKQRIERYGFVENEDYFLHNKFVTQKGRGGHNAKEYALTINMAKELAMVENNDKGREARRYFIKAEETLRELSDNKRLSAFAKLEATKEKLLSNIINLGGSENDFIQIDTNGRRVLFNGSPLPDEELPRVLMLSRDLASEMTNLNLKDGEHTVDEVDELNKTNHLGVRQYIIESTGKMPENLPREKNIKTIKGKKKLDE